MTAPASAPLVSVVTPVYNNVEYLAECIDSVLVQSYQNWEYVIVNNCSTDGSGEVARSYASKEPRIRVIDNQNFLPALANHNGALRQISPSSKYCKVVFADDFLFPECLERMVALAEENPSVGIVSAYGLEGARVVWSGLPYPSTVVRGRELCRRTFLDGLGVLGSATAMLYRAEVVRRQHAFYGETHMHGDTEAHIGVLKTWDFGFVHQVLTFTRPRPKSLSAASASINTHIPGMLHMLRVHGRDVLSREEFDTCVARCITAYYRFLGKNLIMFRDKAFWRFHSKKLTEEHDGFSWPRVAGAALVLAISASVNPGTSVKKLGKLLRFRGERAVVTEVDCEPQPDISGLQTCRYGACQSVGTGKR